MDIPKRDRWMWLWHELFVLSPRCFAGILVFQQLFDLATTLYLTSLPGGIESNPVLAPIWNAPGGIYWLISVKLWACILFGLGVTYIAEHAPEKMWAPKLICLMYWLVVCWNASLVVSTMF